MTYTLPSSVVIILCPGRPCIRDEVNDVGTGGEFPTSSQRICPVYSAMEEMCAHPDTAANPSPALDPSARNPTVLAHPHPKAQGGSGYLAERATASESDTVLSISKVDA